MCVHGSNVHAAQAVFVTLVEHCRLPYPWPWPVVEGKVEAIGICLGDEGGESGWEVGIGWGKIQRAGEEIDENESGDHKGDKRSTAGKGAQASHPRRSK